MALTKITKAMMGDNNTDSDSYVDGSIDEAHLSDNAVSLAKMAGGTDGQIITYDASGNPTAVGPGTDGQVLTSTGAGSPPAFEAISASALTPMFYVYDENADISLTSGTATKVSFPDTLFDADSVFDNAGTDRFTIPSGEGGKYVMNSSVPVHSASNNITDARIKIYKNGSFYHGGYLMGYAANTINRHLAPRLTFIDDAAAADYYEVYVICTATSPKIFADSENKKFSYFYGYKIG